MEITYIAFSTPYYISICGLSVCTVPFMARFSEEEFIETKMCVVTLPTNFTRNISHCKKTTARKCRTCT